MSKARIHTNLVGALVQIKSDEFLENNPHVPNRYIGREAEITNVYLDQNGDPAYTLAIRGLSARMSLWNTYDFAFDVIEIGWRQHRFGK
jgi:hypothetical protein